MIWKRRDRYFYNNEYSDFIMMRILRPEWERINGRDQDGCFCG